MPIRRLCSSFTVGVLDTTVQIPVQLEWGLVDSVHWNKCHYLWTNYDIFWLGQSSHRAGDIQSTHVARHVLMSALNGSGEDYK